MNGKRDTDNSEPLLWKNNPYRKYIMELDIGFYRIATDGMILEHNPAFGSILGFGHDENLVGTSVLDFWENQQERTNYLEEIKKNGQVKNYTVNSKTKNGSNITVQLNSHLEKDEGGHSLWIEGTLNNITKLKQFEERLQQSEAHFNALISATTDEVFLMDKKGLILIANSALARSMGMDRGALTGISAFDIRPSELSKQRKKQIDKVNRTGKKVRFEDQMDGRWFDNSIFPTFDQRGRITGYAVFSRDITDQKQTEELLKNSQKRLKIIYEYAPDAIFLNDIQGVFVDGNKMSEQLLGYRRKELIGKNFFALNILDAEAKEKASVMMAQAVRQNKPSSSYYTLTRKNGSKVPVEIKSFPVKIHGRRLILGIARDMTEFYNAKELLERSSHILEEAQRISGMGSYELDIKKGTWTTSPVLNSIFGIDDSYNKNVKGWLDLVHPGQKKEMQDYLINNVLKKKQIFDREYRILRKNNKEERWVHGLGELEFDKAGEPVRMIGTIQDITDRKRSEEKIKDYQKRLRELNSLLTQTEEMERRHIAINIHDYISQSLAIAKIKLTTLKNQQVSEEIIMTINEITENISDAIKNSRIITSELSPPVLFELGLMAAISWKLDQVSKEHKINSTIRGKILNFPLSENEQILLFRIVSELVTNVVKHAQATRIDIHINDDDKRLSIKMVDDGIGFDTSGLARQSGKRHGFGLFSIKERIEYLGGQFDIVSFPGRGTRVKILLSAENKNEFI